MTITHTVKLPGARQFEMAYFTFSLSVEDLPAKLIEEVTTVQLWRVMEYLVQRELVNLQLQSGHMSLDEAQGRIEYLRQCLGEIAAKLGNYGL